MFYDYGEIALGDRPDALKMGRGRHRDGTRRKESNGIRASPSASMRYKGESNETAPSLTRRSRRNRQSRQRGLPC